MKKIKEIKSNLCKKKRMICKRCFVELCKSRVVKFIRVRSTGYTEFFLAHNIIISKHNVVQCPCMRHSYLIILGQRMMGEGGGSIISTVPKTKNEWDEIE